MRVVAKLVLQILGALLVPANVVAAKVAHLFAPKESVDERTLPGKDSIGQALIVAIVAVNQSGKLCPNLEFFLRSLADRGVALLVFNNGRLEADKVDEIRKVAAHYHERESGKGRDFACYKLGAEVLEALSERHLWQPKRVLLLNDSVLVIPSRLRKFLDQFLARTEPVVAVTESTERQYHVSSWLLSLSWNVWTARMVRGFWARYLPLHSRRWAIREGELGFSKALSKEGIAPFVMYPASMYLGVIRQMGPNELIQKLDLLPIYFVRNLVRRLSSSATGQGMASAEILMALLVYQEFTNQTAFWQLFGGLHAGFPFIKKDIYYRKVFSLSQVRYFFDKLREADDEEVDSLQEVVLGVEDCRSFPLYRRLRFLLGIE